MGRGPRIDVEDGYYHVMNRGAAKQTTFYCDPDRIEFGRLLGVGYERFGVVVHAYCLMTNHFHLLVHCPTGGLSDYMHLVGSTFVRHVNERAGRDGPLFRGRFRSIVVLDDRQLLATTRYIHRNPLALPGVDAAEKYRWSSHRTYLGWRHQPAWMRTDVVLSHFDDVRGFANFVSDDRLSANVGLGGPARRSDVAVVAPGIELALDECSDQLASALQGVARTLLVLYATRLPDDAVRALFMKQLGFDNASAASAATRRALRRAEVDPALWQIVDRAVELVS